MSGSNPERIPISIVVNCFCCTSASSNASACKAETPDVSYHSSEPAGADTIFDNARTASSHKGRIVRSANAR